MQATEIFGPFFAMILLTFVVWIVMYIGRIRYSIANRINAQRLGTPEKVVQVLPEEIQYPAYNLTQPS